MPLDHKPNRDGNLVVVDGVAIGKSHSDKGPFYTSHFATCPQSGKWRKKRGK